MSENGILEAEQRVREMNRLTQQYSEQGNRYLQSMMNAQNFRQTRFEPAGNYPQGNIGQGGSGNSGFSSRNRMEDTPQIQPEQNPQRHVPQQNGNNGNQNGQHNGQQIRNQNWQQNGQHNNQQNRNQNQQHNVQQNWQQNQHQNIQQNRHQNQQQNFRNHQNNNCPPNFQTYCPPMGDPAGERRNIPVHNEIHNNPGNQNHSSGFPDLIADNEKLMILLLIYLLMKEKADIKLILALGYLLL